MATDFDPNAASFPCRSILGVNVASIAIGDAAAVIVRWSREEKPHRVYAANVHLVMEAWDDPEYGSLINGGDLVVPDGMPLVWGLRLLGAGRRGRVYGPDLMLEVLQRAAEEGIAVGFYGGTPRAVNRLVERSAALFPGLSIAYAWSPPFRELTAEEDRLAMAEMCSSGARILFVGLGCPRQERWIASHAGAFKGVMLGVGAAFDFISGEKRQAPRWMMGMGLEWFFRLATEPKRLWRRYFRHNGRFVLFFFLQCIGTFCGIRRTDTGTFFPGDRN